MAVQRYADAAAAFQAELEADPSGILAVAAAAALNSAGRPAEARRQLQEWLVREPDNLDALHALASLELQTRRTDAAEKTLKRLLAVRPNDPVALNNLAWIYQARDDKQARALAQKAYLLGPGPQSADTLGWVLTRQGDPKMGLLLLNQAAQQLNSDPTVMYHFAVALNGVGQKDRAVEVLTRIVGARAEFDEKPAARKLLEELGGPKP